MLVSYLALLFHLRGKLNPSQEAGYDEQKVGALFETFEPMRAWSSAVAPRLWPYATWTGPFRTSTSYSKTFAALGVLKFFFTHALSARTAKHFFPSFFRWQHEILDMMRRLFFVGVVPISGRSSEMKAYVGTAGAFLSTVYYRELLPYRVPLTNVFATLAQYQILFTYIGTLLMVFLYVSLPASATLFPIYLSPS